MTVNLGPDATDRDFYDDKAMVYRHAENDVVVAAVLSVLPPSGRVLDAGCASGELLAKLEGRAGYRAGVELSPVAAKQAATVADCVANLPIMSELPFPRASFDVIVCADVLEHVPDPEAALSWVVQWCKAGGAVVISVPNVANWQARLRLLRGVWRYEPCGLFDSGHLRFLTRETLLELLQSAGLRVESCVPARLPSLALQIPAVARWPRPLRQVVNVSWRALGYRLDLRWPTLFAYQFVCVGRT